MSPSSRRLLECSADHVQKVRHAVKDIQSLHFQRLSRISRACAEWGSPQFSLDFLADNKSQLVSCSFLFFEFYCEHFLALLPLLIFWFKIVSEACVPRAFLFLKSRQEYFVTLGTLGDLKLEALSWACHVVSSSSVDRSREIKTLLKDRISFPEVSYL